MTNNGISRDDRILDCIEQFEASPDGITVDDIRRHQVRTFGGTCSRTLAVTIVQGVRDFLGGGDVMTVACEPDRVNDPSGLWLYRLVANVDDLRWTAANRHADGIRRARTQAAEWEAIVRGTDGRSVEGRRARLWLKTYRRLIEDMADVDWGGGPGRVI